MCIVCRLWREKILWQTNACPVFRGICKGTLCCYFPCRSPTHVGVADKITSGGASGRFRGPLEKKTLRAFHWGSLRERTITQELFCPAQPSPLSRRRHNAQTGLFEGEKDPQKNHFLVRSKHLRKFSQVAARVTMIYS